MSEDRHEAQLRARLAEDMGSAAEADELLPVMLRLKRWQAARVTHAQRQQVVIRLRQAASEQRHIGSIERWLEWRPLLLLRVQIPVVQREIWLASAFLMALGVILTLSLTGSMGGTLTFVLLAPVIAAMGIAFLYNDELEQVLEIERATPDPVGLILLARMSLVFGFDALLGIAASLFVAALQPDVLLWPFVLSWLAPMTLLSSLAFFISVIRRDSVAGILVSLSLWCGYHVWRIASVGLQSSDYSLVAVAPYLMMAAILLVGLALWLVEHRVGALRTAYYGD